MMKRRAQPPHSGVRGMRSPQTPVRVAGWRAEIPPELRDLRAFEYGGVARKPA
jgi:hypothetical protein